MVKVDILILFLLLAEKLSVFHYCIYCQPCVALGHIEDIFIFFFKSRKKDVKICQLFFETEYQNI